MLDVYSRSYEEARMLFHETASRLGASVEKHHVHARRGSDLTISVAVVGDAEPEWSVVVSSGLHGIEGFVGSAVQIAFLQTVPIHELVEKKGQIVAVHSLNPFGFSKFRRANEDNVDLNRNFLLPGERYRGASEGYVRLNHLLNPMRAPASMDLFNLRALWHIWRSGLSDLKQAVAGGQYEFPRGLFFGGNGPAQCHQILQANVMRWIKGRHVMHFDLHSGLGEYAKCKLLVSGGPGRKNAKRYAEILKEDIEVVSDDRQAVSDEQADDTLHIAYKTRGNIGRWMYTLTEDLDYHFFALEFGTYSPIRLLRALRNENRAHFYAAEGSPAGEHAKAELLECFCPKSPSWRVSALERGTALLDRARRAAAQLAPG